MFDDRIFFLIDFETTGISDKALPIEIGVLVLDGHFNILTQFQCYITWPAFDGQGEWPTDEGRTAQTIHKITLQTVLSKGLKPAQVCNHLEALIEDWVPLGSKAVVMSDCVVFEWHRLKQLFTSEARKWPFHYHAWDVYPFFKLAGVEKQGITTHRALADCYQIYQGFIRSLERLGK